MRIVNVVFSCLPCIYQYLESILNAHYKCINESTMAYLQILFIADLKKQTQMAMLSKERDNLTLAVRTYKSLFETTEQLLTELRRKCFANQVVAGTILYSISL